jgi:hypothetical protein
MEPDQSFERFFKDLSLQFSLDCMIDMLPLAATTPAKIRTGRVYPPRGGDDNLFNSTDLTVF